MSGNNIQKLSFSALYHNTRQSVEAALTSLWIGETLNESQHEYGRQMQGIISTMFAPEEAVPLVECMNPYEAIAAEEADRAEALVGELWRKTLPKGKYYLPYKHQVRSWETLLNGFTSDGDPMSMVITTGTGSGKTESFMLPLVQDIINRGERGKVQAIFLYPLNALMDDQKERLEKLVAGTGIRYAVYNGNLAERDDAENEGMQKKIKLAKGTTIDEQTGVSFDRFPNCVATRDELRSNPPEILLTNPTMLEYILLRNKDNSLIEEGALKWIVIDETHTYTGAGAAELSMLLRRVMLAYGVSPRQVRFATSSATIGNNQSPEERVKLMQKFIGGIAGIPREQVAVIDGKRLDVEDVSGSEYAETWNRLFRSARDGHPYMPINELIPQGKTIEEKLEILDRMCADAPKGAKVKVHYFFRVPNGGLFVRLSDKDGGSFKIYTSRGNDEVGENVAPMLELSRCKRCGEFVAVARGNTSEKTYGPMLMDDTDMFDLEPDQSDGEQNLIFALTRGDIAPGDGNQGVLIEGNTYRLCSDLLDKTTGWEVVMNTHNNCPFCGGKLTKKSEDGETESPEDEDSKKLQKFRLPVDFISRLMAPEVLDQLTPSDREGALHRGQQYISFVDSRQGAAKATMRQNMEIERIWLYSRIFHELTRRKLSAGNNTAEIDRMKAEMMQAAISNDMAKVMQLSEHIKKAENAGNGEMSWTEIANFLMEDPMAEVLARQFAKRTSDSDELSDEFDVKESVKRQYIHSIMVENLGRRPPHAAAPETMGVFTTTYPQLKAVRQRPVPTAVEEFNGMIEKESLRISPADWADLMHVYLDYTVRINESVYLCLGEKDPLDIFSCPRFETKKSTRRPAIKSKVSNASRSRVVRYLAQLLVADRQAESIKEALSFATDEIQNVVDALWDELIDLKLLQISTRFKDGRHQQEKEYVKDGVTYIPYRLNVADISFKLYDRAALADTMTITGPRVVKRLRPVETVFKNYSPYLKKHLFPERISTEFEEWEPFTLGTEADREAIAQWAKENRKLLWYNQLWNEFGVFSQRLNEIYGYPELFIQAEHTAQVDKIIARRVQDEFKKRRLNILACSTTMEMGVDLGSLELVMMCSVPPMPSNYKQRAGRSGRNDMVKSASVTLCGSDSIGLRTLLNPMENVIERPVGAPSVDLQSPQVVQRHVNAFLIRESGVFSLGDNGGSISQRAFHYYTDFTYEKNGGHSRLLTVEGREVIPSDGTGTPGAKTPYRVFNEFCSRPLNQGQQKRLKMLLEGTIFEGQSKSVIDNALDANKQSYNELLKKIDFIRHMDWNTLNERQRTLFRMKFYEPLMTQLIGFWGNTRFAPNANMPVNVVTYDVNSSRIKYYKQSTSNPSYDLRNALAQYVPGNPVVMDGRVSVVRGVRYHDYMAKSLVTFKTIYRNDQRTVIDARDEISKRIPWNVNGQEGLKMIQPTEFLPDTAETESRVISNPVYTRVNAQLIGASKWTSSATEPHLFSARSSRQSANSEILYYNEGVGYGYCHCIDCGRIVMESKVAHRDAPMEDLPAMMNNHEPKESGNTPFHYKVGERDQHNKPIYCRGSRDPKLIQRNVVLADTIATDYTEIRIRYEKEQKWISNRRDAHGRLLTTLAILFAQALAEYLGKERDAFGFTVTPNGHICIFDTNPGGAGYSNQLAQIEVMKAVVKASQRIVNSAIAKRSKEVILDKFTMQFAQDIDLKLAKKWLDSEVANAEIVPDAVVDQLGQTSAEISLTRLGEAIENARGQVTLFFNSDFHNWNYGNVEEGWLAYHNTLLLNAGAMVKICVIANKTTTLTMPAIMVLRKFEALGMPVVRCENPFETADIYPVAIVDGKMFVTNNPESATLNEYWCNGSLYSSVSLPSLKMEPCKLSTNEDSVRIFTIGGSDCQECMSDRIGYEIYKRAQNLCDAFKEYCAGVDTPIEITYQDEHMKSLLGITVALQAINYFVELFESPFTLKFNVESYNDSRGSARSITKNLPNSADRDYRLKMITRQWLETNDGISGTLAPVESQERGSLTHWRVLSFKCGDKTLSIYPDGGFMTGWKLNDSRSLSEDDMMVSNPIALRRTEDLKFDVTIE